MCLASTRLGGKQLGIQKFSTYASRDDLSLVAEYGIGDVLPLRVSTRQGSSVLLFLMPTMVLR